MAGTLDPPTHLKLVLHIFVESKSDYYALDDGVACQTGGDHRVAVPEA